MKKLFLIASIFFLALCPKVSVAQSNEIIIETNTLKVLTAPINEEDQAISGFEYKLILQYENKEYILSKNFNSSDKASVFLVPDKGVIFPFYRDASGYELNFFNLQTKEIINITPYSPLELGLDEYFWFSDFQLSPSKDYLSVFIASKDLHETCVYFLKYLPEVKVICPLRLLGNNQTAETAEEITGNIWNLKWDSNDTFTFYYTKNYFWEENQSIEESMKYELKEIWKSDITGENLQKIGELQEKDFTDIDNSNEMFEILHKAKIEGWLDGYPDGTVRLNNKINRAEFAKLVIKAFKQQEVIPATGIVSIFPDVPAQAWYGSTLYTALQLKLITGYPDGLARPEKNINKLEALKVVLNMLGKDYSKKDIQYGDTLPDQWYSGYTNFSLNQEPSLLPSDQSGNLNPTEELTRGEAIELISKVLVLK